MIKPEPGLTHPMSLAANPCASPLKSSLPRKLKSLNPAGSCLVIAVSNHYRDKFLIVLSNAGSEALSDLRNLVHKQLNQSQM